MAILAPIVALIVTGSMSAFAAVYGAEVLIVVAARQTARRLGLPAWAPDEAYVTRLVHWRRARRS